jgi:hypothetical protein
MVDNFTGWLGVPYLYGGISKLGVDCSGFTQAMYQAIGINIGRTTTQQFAKGTPVGTDGAQNYSTDIQLLQPGDLIFYGQPGASGPNAHVVMYTGNNQVVQAGGANVNQTALFSAAGADEPFLGIRRYTNFTGGPGSSSGATASSGMAAAGTAQPSLGTQVSAELTSVATTVGLTENELAAYTFFVGKGLTPAQSAGIVGNLMQESNVNPEEPGGGIAQWIGSRWNPDLQTGVPSTDLVNQLNYLWGELNGPYSGALTALQATSDPTSAAAVISNDYEEPGIPDLSNRESYATTVFAATQNLTSAQLTSAFSWLPDYNPFTQKNSTSGLSGAADVASAGATILGDLTSGQFWDRILLFAGGLALAGVGLIIFISTTKAGKTVESDAVLAAAA